MSNTGNNKAVIDNITSMAYVQEVNYPSTSFHLRHNACTILDTRSQQIQIHSIKQNTIYNAG